MAHELPKDVIAEFVDVFKLFDTDGDGEITTKELGAVLQNLGIHASSKELQSIVQMADLDDNGTIDQTEFLNIMYNRFTAPKEDLLSACFRQLDKDQSGSISTPELLHAMKALGERMTQEEADAMLRLGDADGDGVISFEDFVAVMQQSLQYLRALASGSSARYLLYIHTYKQAYIEGTLYLRLIDYNQSFTVVIYSIS